MRDFTFYLGTPGSALHAHLIEGMPVLVSFAAQSKWLKRSWMTSFGSLLLDSGAFSEMNSGKKVDLMAYIDWAQQYSFADAWAGLDSITGNWRQSMANYRAPGAWGSFPTFHDSDPPELLSELIKMAQERKSKWIGIGLVPPRGGKEIFMKETLEQIPDDLHVHAWACGMYTYFTRIDSTDSTNWFRDSFKLSKDPLTSHLTPAECLKIVLLRYERSGRKRTPKKLLSVLKDSQLSLYSETTKQE